jgi:hypothetical protein
LFTARQWVRSNFVVFVFGLREAAAPHPAGPTTVTTRAQLAARHQKFLSQLLAGLRHSEGRTHPERKHARTVARPWNAGIRLVPSRETGFRGALR